ncbi:methylmalonyl Co-A mutase-associated GTPase MeaB [Pseudomonadota bacterium]
MSSVEKLVSDLLDGNVVALSRAITEVENNQSAAKNILTAIQPHLGKAAVIGITGPPGVGKSTLCNALISELRCRNKTVAIVATDPSSPFSGGAVLGDRIRMSHHDEDPGVYIRSMASRGHLGGLSANTVGVIDLMDASGWDFVVLETVGAGQSEVEVAEVADTRIVVCTPGMGDDIQAIKAGILEIADIFVVNKADLPLAEGVEKQLLQMLQLRQTANWQPPVLKTIASQNQGISELLNKIIDHRRQHPLLRRHNSMKGIQHQLAQLAARQLEQEILTSDKPEITALCESVQRGEMDIFTAANSIQIRFGITES